MSTIRWGRANHALGLIEPCVGSDQTMRQVQAKHTDSIVQDYPYVSSALNDLFGTCEGVFAGEQK